MYLRVTRGDRERRRDWVPPGQRHFEKIFREHWRRNKEKKKVIDESTGVVKKYPTVIKSTGLQ